MNTHRNHIIRNLTLVALAFVAALFFLGAQSSLQHATHPADHDSHDPHHVAQAIEHAGHELQAHTDMEVFAAIHYGNFVEVPDTFGGTTEWDPDYDLHWMQIDHDGHVALLYHLSSKHDDGHRLVNLWDSNDHSWTGWNSMQ